MENRHPNLNIFTVCKYFPTITAVPDLLLAVVRLPVGDHVLVGAEGHAALVAVAQDLPHVGLHRRQLLPLVVLVVVLSVQQIFDNFVDLILALLVLHADEDVLAEELLELRLPAAVALDEVSAVHEVLEDVGLGEAHAAAAHPAAVPEPAEELHGLVVPLRPVVLVLLDAAEGLVAGAAEGEGFLVVFRQQFISSVQEFYFLGWNIFSVG